MNHGRIAILGGGMLGTCTGLELARRGARSTLFEGASSLLQGASRWSEGKIHLGFVYAGDPTLGTARRLIPGGLAFAGLVERLIHRSLDAFITEEDEIFLVHRDSVANPEAFEAYGRRTAELVREAASQPDAPQYLCDVTRAAIRRLSPSELGRITSADEVVAGYRVPERSISTVALAELVQEAVASEPLIEIRAGTWVTAVERGSDGRFDVRADAASVAPPDAPFDVVINALWEGRPAVDASLGIKPIAPWSHRFRAAVFAHAPDVSFQSAVVCTGPFGDVKRYADGRVYLKAEHLQKTGSYKPRGMLNKLSTLSTDERRRSTDREAMRSCRGRCNRCRTISPRSADCRIQAKPSRFTAGGSTRWVKAHFRIRPARCIAATGST